MNRICRPTCRGGGPVRNLRGQRGVGPYPAICRGFCGHGRDSTMNRGDSNQLKKLQASEKVEVRTTEFGAGRLK